MAVPVFMVITGYLASKSISDRDISLKDSYRPKEIAPKWIRFLIPYSIVYFVERIWILYSGEELDIIKAVELYITGSCGPGFLFFCNDTSCSLIAANRLCDSQVSD